MEMRLHMKILKVNNYHAAVAHKEEKISGIAYKKDAGKDESIENIIHSRARNVAGLYKIFGNVQAGTEPKEPSKPQNPSQQELEYYNKRFQNYRVKKDTYELRKKIVENNLANSANKVLEKIIWEQVQGKNGFFNRGEMFPDNATIIKNIKKTSQRECGLVKRNADTLIIFALRSSLYDVREGLKCLINNLGNANITQSDIENIGEFLNALRKDFTKNKSRVTIYAKAIKNQNLIVQPNEKGVISLSTPKQGNAKSNNRKDKEKAAFNAFLLEYANVDENKRAELLGKLYQLVSLYFATPENADEGSITDFTVSELKSFDAIWSAHEKDKKRDGFFVNPPQELLVAYQNHSVLEKQKLKELDDTLQKSIRSRNSACYRYAIKVTELKNSDSFFENQNMNQFWIHHIEDAVERILADNKEDKSAQRTRLRDSLFRLELSYLVPKVWKDVINLLSLKYIATGKAVFHFAMDGLEKTGEKQKEDVTLGKLDDTLLKGLTSFDYEMIKAKETLQREIAVHIAFATNTLSRAVVDMSKLEDNDSDILLWNKGMKNYDKCMSCLRYDNQDDLLNAMLQFFGGKTKWETSQEIKDYFGKDKYGTQMFMDIKDMIYSLRNDNFHFVSMAENNKNKYSVVHSFMFNKELEGCDGIEKNRFYSNNLHLFYKQNDLEIVMNKLYEKVVPRAASIPSFNTVFVRKIFETQLTEIAWRPKFSDSEYQKKWVSGLYYLFKEIYYNDFLQSKDANRLLDKVVAALAPQRGEDDYQAINSFIRKYKECSGSIAEKCQQIMTDYNQHNNQHRKSRTAYDSILDKELYKNYPLMLKKCLSKALCNYIKDNYAFLANPVTHDYKEIGIEEFLPEWESGRYDSVKEKFAENYYLQKWYFTCHFLPAKSLNLLVGSMRSYLQYVEDVKRRSNKRIHKEDRAYYDRIKSAITIVEICIKLSNTFSNNFKDYFIADNSEEEYANYLSKFIDLDDKFDSKFTALKMFGTDGTGSQSNIYTDPSNAIANRNIIMSKLFGPTHILEQIMSTSKLTGEDLDEFRKQTEKILSYKNNGICKTREEQINLISYQRIKNRIELRNLVEYGELINDLLGQLIGWSFIRERDLLYFQLGYHYYCLHNDKADNQEAYGKIKVSNGYWTSNVILRQIMGLYVNGIGVYVYNADNSNYEEKAAVGGVGPKIISFTKYTETLGYSEYALYNAGLELFENVKEHESIVKIRNFIDHFKYYVSNQYSLLGLYSEVFDRFFTYDMKYHKNVVNVFENILIKYNVLAEPCFRTGEKTYDDGSTKNSAKIDVSQLMADRFTYKLSDGKEVKMDAKDMEYLKIIQAILYLNEKENPYVPKIKSSPVEDREDDVTDGKKNNKSSKKNTNKGKNFDEKKYSNSGSINSPFAELFSKMGITPSE